MTQTPRYGKLDLNIEDRAKLDEALLDTRKKERMIIGFTCKVCQTRSFKSMSKQAYNTGVVLIKCDGCKKTHLIADNLGWYDSQKPPGTIEEILAAKGEKVERILFDPRISHIATAPQAAAVPEENSKVQEEGDIIEFVTKE